MEKHFKKAVFQENHFLQMGDEFSLVLFPHHCVFFYPGEAKGLAAILMYNTRLSGCGSWDLAATEQGPAEQGGGVKQRKGPLSVCDDLGTLEIR